MEKLRAIFAIEELRKRILLTLGLLAIYRVGYSIPLPFVNQLEMNKGMGSGGLLDSVFGYVSMFSGGDLSRATIFGLGIMPYITASIIFQLLAYTWGPLEKLMKEGESGQKKINDYTRVATVFVCLFQAFLYVQYVTKTERAGGSGWALPDFDSWPYMLTMVLTMTAGTVLLMWLGEQIDEYGIGNGISLIIMAGIVARMPGATINLFFDGTRFKTESFTLGGAGSQDMSFEKLIVLVCMFVAVVVAVIYFTKGQRRIPTQSAKHVRGRRVMSGGNRQFLPLKVNQASVMPVIFASSFLVLPMFAFGAIAQSTGWSWATFLNDAFMRQGYLYSLLFIALIYIFCYFWTTLISSPQKIADNLKEHGSFIPGYRPGKRTSEYLERVILRLTYVGAAFLVVVALIPTVITAVMDVPPRIADFYGGTTLLIAISVVLDVVQKINSHLVMRNYPGLTED